MPKQRRRYPAYDPPWGRTASQQGPTFRAPTATFQGNPVMSFSGGVPTWRLEGGVSRNPTPELSSRPYYHSLENEVDPLDQEPHWLNKYEDEFWNDSPTLAKAKASLAEEEAALPWNQPYSDSNNWQEACQAIYKRMGGEEEAQVQPPTSSSGSPYYGPPLVNILLMDDKMRNFAERVAGALGLSTESISDVTAKAKEKLVNERKQITTRQLILLLIDGENGVAEKVDLFYFSQSTILGVRGRECMPFLEAVGYIKLKWPIIECILDRTRQLKSGCPVCGKKVRCADKITCLASILPPY